MSVFKAIFLLFLGAVILTVSGCNDAKEGQLPDQRAKAPSVVSPINPKIKSSESIAIVNGAAIRRDDYDRWIVLRARDFCVANGLDLQKRSEKLDQYIWSTRDVALTDMIRRELIRQECEKKPIVVSNKVLVATQRRFMKRIRRPNESFEEYVKELPEDQGEELRKQVFCDARDEVFLKNWATNDIEHVSAVEVSNRISFVQKYNKEIEELNADSKRRAAAAKAEILAGASFCQVATNRADIFIDQAELWDIAEIGEFEPEEDIFKFLTTAKQGDISDPLDFDDGIGLVGVLLKEKEEQDDGTGSELFTLVRCMFNGYDPIEESDDFETVRRSLLEDRVKAAREALVTELFKSAKIEFPFGKKLFAKKKAKGANKPKKKQPAKKKKKSGRLPSPGKAKPVPDKAKSVPDKAKPVPDQDKPVEKAKPGPGKGGAPSTSNVQATGV